MHTPEQAKELWCPMGRIGVMPSHGGPAGVNDPTVQFRCNCIADKCAMWRAEPKSQVPRISLMCKQFDAEVEPQRPAGMNPEFVFSPYEPGDADGACWIEPEHVWLARRRGYCGLAGRHEVS